ncbi:TPA: hypothetical protein ACTXAA_001238 [Raoultella planticola]
MKDIPIHIQSRLSRLGGMFSLELLLADLADELVGTGDARSVRKLRDAADVTSNLKIYQPAPKQENI